MDQDGHTKQSICTSIYCVIGLGNPGKRYRRTRHNIGFSILDVLCSKFHTQFTADGEMFQSVTLIYEGKTLLLCKPLTHMNRSGEAAEAIFHNQDILLDRLLVVCDDIALPTGAIRLRRKGSSAGQKGLESIIVTIESDRFARLRCGIGPVSEERVLSDYVLGKFERNEKGIVQGMMHRASDAIISWIRDGIDTTMNVYNVSTN